MLTSPQIDAIKSIGEEVISNSISSPVLASARVRDESFSVSPPNADVGRLTAHSFHMINDGLIVPLLVHSRTLASTHIDVGRHAVHMVHNPGLQEKISARQEVLQDEVLVGTHSHPTSHTQGAQHIQNLEKRDQGKV